MTQEINRGNPSLVEFNRKNWLSAQSTNPELFSKHHLQMSRGIVASISEMLNETLASDIYPGSKRSEFIDPATEDPLERVARRFNVLLNMNDSRDTLNVQIDGFEAKLIDKLQKDKIASVEGEGIDTLLSATARNNFFLSAYHEAITAEEAVASKKKRKRSIMERIRI